MTPCQEHGWGEAGWWSRLRAAGGHGKGPPPKSGVRSLPTTHHPAGKGLETSRAQARQIDGSLTADLFTRGDLFPILVPAAAWKGRGRVWGVAWRVGRDAAVGCEPRTPPGRAATSPPGLAALPPNPPDHARSRGLHRRSPMWVTTKPQQRTCFRPKLTMYDHGPAHPCSYGVCGAGRGHADRAATCGARRRAVGAGTRPVPRPGSRCGTGIRTPGCRRRRWPAPARSA